MVVQSRSPFITCIRVVSALIRADDVVSEEESAFLENMMNDMSFNEEERAAAAQPIDLDAGMETLSTLSTPMKKVLLETLIKASRSDGHIDSRELAFVEQLAVRFGLPEDTVGELWVGAVGRPAQRDDAPDLEHLDISRLEPADE